MIREEKLSERGSWRCGEVGSCAERGVVEFCKEQRSRREAEEDRYSSALAREK